MKKLDEKDTVSWFWNAIDGKRVACSSDEQFLEAMEECLLGMSDDELVSFQTVFEQMMSRCCKAEIRAAVHHLQQGSGDEAFSDFCYWLISRGKQFFECVISEPDHLASLSTMEMSLEEFGSLASEIYYERRHTEMPVQAFLGLCDVPTEMTTEEWARAHLPRVLAACGFTPFFE